MAYRNGTYVAFHANGTTEPTESDMKYYRLLVAWNVRDDQTFEFVNSHEKTSAVRDSSRRETLRRSLVTRLNNSKNMILIIGETTREDTDWVPFEVAYAIDECGIPIIAAYTGYEWVLDPGGLSHLWPDVLRARINAGTAGVIHVPFKQLPLTAAVKQFSHNNLPTSGHTHYTEETYRRWGIIR